MSIENTENRKPDVEKEDTVAQAFQEEVYTLAKHHHCPPYNGPIHIPRPETSLRVSPPGVVR